jgi:tetratricopeptide (TPR) repeat protein
VPVLSNESVEQAYVEIAKKLGLQRSNDDENFKELVCRFLSSNEAGTWLLIVDNADDPELVFGSENESGIDQFLPESENGLVLLTTRSRQIGVTFAQVDIIDIEGMQQEEASHLLEKSLIRKQLLHDTTLVKELLMQLAYLPLAITQAAAYLNQTMAPIQAYLQHLQGIGNNVARILGREFKDNTRYRGSRNAVATTWLVSFDQIEKSDPLAVSLLSFISCIEPKAIPRSILPMTDLEEQEWAIGTLCGYSFLVRRGDSDVFDMHSLVQLAMREWVMKQNRRHQVIEDAMHHLRDVLSSTSYAARDSWGYYLPHALRVLYENEKPETDDLYNLFSQVGDYLESQRRFKEAMKCYEEVCHYKQKHLSEQNASRLTSEQVLGSVYIENRQIKKAISILEHVVSVRKDISDETDPERLTSQHELARAYLDNSQIKDAIEILEHVVSRRKDTLEEKDDERLASEHALAMAYIDCGRNEDAIGIIEHVVAVTAETMDMTDHERLASEHELARAYLNSGRTKDAIAILQHVVAVEKETLNEKDHDRLVTEHVLARAYVDDGRIKDAIEILERVVSIRKETLNEKDPERIYSEQELARAYRADGRV